MDFYNKAGKMALGSRLRRLSEMLTDQASHVYALYDIKLQPKWFPVFYTLSEGQAMSIKDIAVQIGHSHASVSTIVKEMTKADLVKEVPGDADGRRNFVTLTRQGKLLVEKIADQYKDVNAAIEKAMSETQYNLWKAIEEWEFLLRQQDLVTRVRTEKKIRESKAVQIVPYNDRYQRDFKKLNEEWIKKFFKMEETDYKSLDHPNEYILDKGGEILVALYEDQVVGVCALIPMERDVVELAKMAVAPVAKGKGIGWLLGQAALAKARELGASKVYLESNTILEPAISLYYKLGFKKIVGVPSPYERCNIQMELSL